MYLSVSFSQIDGLKKHPTGSLYTHPKLFSVLCPSVLITEDYWPFPGQLRLWLSDARLIAAVSIRVSPLHNFDCCIPELDLMVGGRGDASITTIPNRRARVLLGIVVDVKCVTNNLTTLTCMRE